MNPWDIDPSLYAAFWRMLRTWYINRKSLNHVAKAVPQKLPTPAGNAGCRA